MSHARETLGLVLILAGLALLGATGKAVVNPTSPIRPALVPEIEEFQPVQPPLRCPMRVMVMTPLDLDGEKWIFAVPTSCATA